MKKTVFLWIILFLTPIISLSQITSDTVGGWYVSGNVGGNTRAQMSIVDYGIRGRAMLVDLELISNGVANWISISKDFPSEVRVPNNIVFGMWRKFVEVNQVEDAEFWCQINLEKYPVPPDTVYARVGEWNRSTYLGYGKWDSRITFNWHQDWYGTGGGHFNRITLDFFAYSPKVPVFKVKFLLDDLNYCQGTYWDGITKDSVGEVKTVHPMSKFNIVYERFGDSPQPLKIEKLGNEIPTSCSLEQNYPNPFNPSTKIRFNIHKAEQVSLVIYDALGREVETLLSESLNPGIYEKTWNAKNLASGIYFYKLKTASNVITKKMILSK